MLHHLFQDDPRPLPRVARLVRASARCSRGPRRPDCRADPHYCTARSQHRRHPAGNCFTPPLPAPAPAPQPSPSSRPPTSTRRRLAPTRCALGCAGPTPTRCVSRPLSARLGIHDVLSAVDDQVPPASLKKDKAHWRRWSKFMDLKTLPASGRRLRTARDVERESFLQAAFVSAYPKPYRAAADPCARPERQDYLTSVRRVHARRDVGCRPPLVSKVVKGIVKRYVREHGIDSLDAKTRRERACARHSTSRTARPYWLASPVDWESLPFICFAALVKPPAADGRSQGRPHRAHPCRVRPLARCSPNLTYRIADVDHDDPTVEQLRS